jgi:uracil-DNA glycosylase
MENVKQSWLNIFEKYDNQNNLNINYKLQNILSKMHELNTENITIFPKEEDIFNAFKYFEIHEIKVVLIGQDPYHGPSQATGLCFGINNNKLPPSLKNIIKELKNDLNIDLDHKNQNLEHWAKQGILMLNAALSVLKGIPGSHMHLWSAFTSYIVEELIKVNKNIIFVAWGAFAYNKLNYMVPIDNNNNNKLIVSSHPSPLSAYKNFKNYPAFNGSKPFSKINNLLEEQNQKKIEW